MKIIGIGWVIDIFIIASLVLENDMMQNVSIFVLWALSFFFLFIAILPWKKTFAKKYKGFKYIIYMARFATVVLVLAGYGWFCTAAIYLFGKGLVILRYNLLLSKEQSE